MNSLARLIPDFLKAARFLVPGLSALLLLPASGVSKLSAADNESVAPQEFWESHVIPIFRDHCWKCHGSVKQKSGLDLRSVETTLQGGDSGLVVEVGDPESSLLIQMLHPDAETRMPPKGDPLDMEQVAVLKAWITRLGQVKSGETGTAEWVADSSGKQSQAEPDDIRSRVSRAPVRLGVAPRRAVDWMIENAWRSEDPAVKLDTEIRPELASDSAFVRRIYLDLVGRIPTREEVQEFVQTGSHQKREVLVDQLLASEEHAKWMAVIFDWVFLGRGGPHGNRDRRQNQGWIDYLEWAFRENRSWDSMTRDLITARPEDPEAKGARYFLFGFNNQPQQAAERMAPALFGKQIQCAQCHDHPLAPEIRQDHYWGLVAFLRRSSNVKGPDGPALAERATGGFEQFNTLAGEARDALPIFIGNNKPVALKPETDPEESPELYLMPPEPGIDQQFEKKAPQVQVVATPKESWREALARQAIDENPEFGRAVVNRIWAYLIGRGLVHPVDKMDSAHPASHPDLLDWLTVDFQESGYDLRRLIREIVLSRVYQLEAWDADQHGGILKPQPTTFSYAMEKPLPGEAIARSAVVALSGLEPGVWSKLNGTSLDPAQLTRSFVDKFPELFEETPGATVHQALFLTNNPGFNQVTRQAEADLISQMQSADSVEAGVNLAFESVFGRRPDSEELEMSLAFLGDGKDIRRYADLVWALLASAEFRFNH